MKRRDFLKLIGVAVVAPGIAVAAALAPPKQRVYAITCLSIPYGIPYWVDLKMREL